MPIKVNNGIVSLTDRTPRFFLSQRVQSLLNGDDSNVNQPDYLMTLIIVTHDKTNSEILQLMEDIQSGVKGRLAEYDEFIERGAMNDIKHESFESMFQSFRDTHMSGYSIG